MTIAKQLNHDFSKGCLYLYESDGNRLYYENASGFWRKREYDSDGNQIYFEDSNGHIEDNRPKSKCEGKTVVIDGVEYELKEKK